MRAEKPASVAQLDARRLVIRRSRVGSPSGPATSILGD